MGDVRRHTYQYLRDVYYYKDTFIQYLIWLLFLGYVELKPHDVIGFPTWDDVVCNYM